MIEGLVEYVASNIYDYSSEIILVTVGLVLFSIFAWILGHISFSCYIECEYNGTVISYLGFIVPYLLFITFAIIALLFCLYDSYLFLLLIVIPMTMFDVSVEIESSNWELQEQEN